MGLRFSRIHCFLQTRDVPRRRIGCHGCNCARRTRRASQISQCNWQENPKARPSKYLGAKAVASSSDPTESQALHVIETGNDDWIDLFRSMRIVSVRAVGYPPVQIKVVRHLQGHWVTIEDIQNQAGVAFGSKCISHQFAGLPNTEHVWNVDKAAVSMENTSAFGKSQVCSNSIFNFKILPRGSSPYRSVPGVSLLGPENIPMECFEATTSRGSI